MGITPTYSFKSGRLWLPINYTYMDLQSDKYYTGVNVTPTYLHLVTQRLGLEVGAKYNRQYYWTPVFLTQDNLPAMPGGAMWGCTTFSKSRRGMCRPAWAICTTTPPATTGIAEL